MRTNQHRAGQPKSEAGLKHRQQTTRGQPPTRVKLLPPSGLSSFRKCLSGIISPHYLLSSLNKHPQDHQGRKQSHTHVRH